MPDLDSGLAPEQPEPALEAWQEGDEQAEEHQQVHHHTDHDARPEIAVLLQKAQGTERHPQSTKEAGCGGFVLAGERDLVRGDGLLAQGLEGREDRRSHSLLKGPSPTLRGFKTEVLQNEFIVGEVQRALNEGLTPREVAIFARSGSHLKSVRQSLTEAGIPVYALSSDDDLDQSNGVNFGTMHRAKGLEFKVVFVVNCSDDVVPHAYTLSKLQDEGDHEAGVEREKQLLYVSITRARDEVFVTWVGRGSRFLKTQQGSTLETTE